jgi:type II secretory pathway component PulF
MTDALRERLHRAWLRHPVVAFLRHAKVASFYRQLHALIRAGVPLSTAFVKLTEFAPDEAMRSGLKLVSRDVRQGSTLSAALLRHSSSLFGDTHLELIAVAEEAGRLEAVTASINNHLEQVQKQRWQTILGAMYPLGLVLAAVFLGPLIRIGQLYKPGASLVSLYIHELVRSLSSATALFIIAFAFPLMIATLNQEAAWERLVRRVPLWSVPLKTLTASRFVLALGLAISSGLEAVRSIRLAVRASSSATAAAALPRAEQALLQGGSLTDSIALLQILDGAASGRIAVGEATGTLDETLERMGHELEEAAFHSTRVAMGVITGLVTAAVLVTIVVAIVGGIAGTMNGFYRDLGKLE